MQRNQLVSYFFIALLLCILYNVLYILSPFMEPMFWGAMLAFAFYPAYEECSRRLGKNRLLGAGITSLLIFFIFVPTVIFVLLMAAKEAVHFYEWLMQAVQSGDIDPTFERFQHLPWIQKVESWKIIQSEDLINQLKDWVLNSAGLIGHFVLKHARLLTHHILTGLFNFFLTFFLVFFFLYDGEKIYRFVYEITPLDERNKVEIFKQLSDTLSATLRGQLFTALAQAATLGLVFWILRLPLPVFFAAITFLAALIPVIGAATVWVPFTIYLAVTQQMNKAVLLFFLGALGISGIDNILKAILIGHKTKLPYSLLFLGIMGGIQVYGLKGIFLAPACLSLFFVLIKIYQEKFSEPTA